MPHGKSSYVKFNLGILHARYYKKRALRIMPPYYGILLIIVMLVSSIEMSSKIPKHIW